MSLAILVPVLARPHRVKPLLDSIEASTPGARVVFLADPDDDEEVIAIRRERKGRDLYIELLLSGGTYAQKINRGVKLTSEPYIFFGADDLEFKPGWYEAAKAKLGQVVGVNDLIPRRRNHATHFLVSREYAEQPAVDGEAGPLHEGYSHWFTDDEFIATAKARGAYTYAQAAHVEHLHPMVGAEDDETYRKGRSRARLDRKTFQRRERLWTSRSA